MSDRPAEPVPPNPATAASDPGLLTACEVRAVPLALTADTFASGLNSSLRRRAEPECSSAALHPGVRLRPAWRASQTQVTAFGFVLPDAFELLSPPEAPSASPAGEDARGALVPLRPPQPVRDSTAEAQRKRRTRLRPPDSVLSLRDRLFYLLQPPLESWLGGQEMIMPFEPFPYQYEGVAWLFSQQSALLADEMGLGKTMQCITAMRLLLRSGQARRILLICPKPLIPNWCRELRMWAEEIPFVVVEGDSSRRRMLWTVPGIPVLIANYELLVRDFAELPEDERPVFDLMVLDEAQRIKNRDSRTAQTAREVTRRRSWALTGTPIENRHEELAALFEFMEVVPPRGVPDLRQLGRLSKRFILRRTKDLVMTDLPPRIDREAHLDLTDAQELAYRTAEKQGVIQLNELGDEISIQHVFELVLRLKQISNFDPLTGHSAKLDRLAADMEEIAASGGKAILFSQWTRCLDWLAERLGAFNPLIYHGGVPTRRREPILTRFQEDPDAHLLLMSYGTGAVGLNLQFAGYVFLFDRWWNPAVEDQAINRAHRIGQQHPVIVTKFISRNTIEERIDLVLRQKRALFDAILGSGQEEGNVSLSLTAGEIFGLFDLKARQADGTRKIDPGQSAA